MSLMEIITSGLILTLSGIAWFILNLRLNDYYTKREIDTMVVHYLEERNETFVRKDVCSQKHNMTESIMADMKEDIKDIKDSLKGIYEMMNKYFIHGAK